MGNTDKFEMIANQYDTPERIQIAELASGAIRRYLADTKSKNAIDFGCGTGLVGMSLLNDFNSMLFLDTSKNMIDQVKGKIANSNVQNAATLCFDLEKGELPDLRADYIFMVQVLLHIKEVVPVLSRLYEALSPSGHLLIIDFDKNEEIATDMVHPGFDQSELAGVMTKIGYKAIQSGTFYTGNKIFMGRDASLFILDARK